VVPLSAGGKIVASQQSQIQQQPQQVDAVVPVALSSAISLAVAGFLAKWAFTHILGQWQRQVEDLRAEIKALTADQVIVKTEYVSKEEFLRVTTRFEFHMDRLGEKIDKLLER
jgi:hypothetical protein